ncbi:MAG: 1,4-alpha-glucan branching enzyme GlgB [Chlamydiae bacterium]|nr:1,4-alpha-glucan branching enzyme GlgB [Chlamydiota bacterium]
MSKELVAVIPHCSARALPSMFHYGERKVAIDNAVRWGLAPKGNELTFRAAKEAIEQVRLTVLAVLILKIVNIVIKIFNANYNKIDGLLSDDQLGKLLIQKYVEILTPEKGRHTSLRQLLELGSEDIASLIEVGIYELQRYQLTLFLERISAFEEILKNSYLSNKEVIDAYCDLPEYLRTLILHLIQSQRSESIEKNPRILLEKNGTEPSILDQLKGMFSTQIVNYLKVIDGGGKEQSKRALASIRRTDWALEQLRKEIDGHDFHSVYDISVERLAKGIHPSILQRPITVTMVGVEYAGLIKQGGLAEALEGLSRGIKEQHPENKVHLVFPKYSHLPKEVEESLKDPALHVNGKGETYQVYKYENHGVVCHFIEHVSFELESEKPNIYGPDYASQAKRFATFSELAADYIYEAIDTDLIHLHDWHVSGVALKLKNDHEKQWKEGEIPPIVFTFHNNSRAAQGRIPDGPYSYDPVVKGYQDAGILRGNDNLFISTLLAADAVTTVSEMFGRESQELAHGEGASFAVRLAAKVGKLTGIINGTNPYRWNPETDPTLKGWKDVETGQNIDLSYGPQHENLIGKKGECKAQLHKWTEKYMPNANIDFSKPIVTYIGRFDSYQKGLDKFEEAINATLKAGGQFICMGIGEDARATRILDRLQKKYKQGVLFIRDYKDPNGRFHYQQGNEERPGIGSLIRAATDFLFIPSKFEPCGLVQFEGWLFGSLAIGSRTGGLADTIIPQEGNAESYNGFLFDREGNSETSAGVVIEKALGFWSELSEKEKNASVKRIIEDGRQYGWTSSPRGFSPAEKYRFTYEKARRSVHQRGVSPDHYNRLEALKYRSPTGKSSSTLSAEEGYHYQYYMKNHQSAYLDGLFQKLSEKKRIQVPTPYGVNVNSKKYESNGAFASLEGTLFSVHAPKAKKVVLALFDEDESLSGEFPMQRGANGNWVIQLSHARPGHLYQLKIDGKVKVDPYGRLHTQSKDPKKVAPFSVVTSSSHEWGDEDWMRKRLKDAGISKPMSIYELHPTTWKKHGGAPLNYRELADKLVKHCEDLGYTHVELMGILEHPHDQTWGYLPLGYFAPNSRMGLVDDFKYLVETLHQNKIGVILDWVPAHFTNDAYGLSNFDGSSLYEASGFWHFFSARNLFFNYGGKHFDYSKKEVREFLISSAAFWLKEMHIDGLRVDCVRSLLNSEDLTSARLFLRDLNAIVHREGGGAFTFAEEFSGDRSVTLSTSREGLDFDWKWHSGWMHLTMQYFANAPHKRKNSYGTIRKAIDCDNFHKQVMFFSHDQVKKGLKTLINQTSGLKDAEQKYANVRAMLSFMMCLPGKKLQFMGMERGNEIPWDIFLRADGGVMDQNFSERERQEGLMAMVARFNFLYKSEKALYEADNNGKDLEWITDPEKRVHAYRRKSSNGSSLACFHNFTDKEATKVTVRFKGDEGKEYSLTELINTDDIEFGGSGRINKNITFSRDGEEICYTIQVPPLSTVVIREQ